MQAAAVLLEDRQRLDIDPLAHVVLVLELVVDLVATQIADIIVKAIQPDLVDVDGSLHDRERLFDDPLVVVVCLAQDLKDHQSSCVKVRLTY
jgi:hypothetical protein